MFSVDEAHNKTLKIERLQSSAPPFRRSTPTEEVASSTGVQLSFVTVDRPELVSRPTPLLISTSNNNRSSCKE